MTTTIVIKAERVMAVKKTGKEEKSFLKCSINFLHFLLFSFRIKNLKDFHSVELST